MIESIFEGVACGNCRFWYRAGSRPITEGDAGGECRRNAPRPATVNSYQSDSFYASWPSTGAAQWCGEFEHKSSPDNDEQPFEPDSREPLFKITA